MRIGIFGGSFNPPHKMHKDIALNLIKNNYVDKVIYVPTGDKYNKKDLERAIDRYNMLKIMIEGHSNLEVSDYELKSTLTYTYQTLDYFQKLYKNDQIYFICGSDNLKDIPNWRNPKYILDNYKILVIGRNNDNLEDIIKNLNTTNIIISNIPLNDISSSEIRNNLKEGKEIDEMLDKNVLKYILERKLYVKR